MKRLEDFVPAEHPLRAIRERVNLALVNLDSLFAQMYAADYRVGRPSIAPENVKYEVVNSFGKLMEVVKSCND